MCHQQIFTNILLVFSLFLFIFIKETKQEYKTFSIDDPKLCSPITKRKVKYEGLVVDQGRSINEHSLSWKVNNLCKFEFQSLYHKGGVLVVIQKLNLRKNFTTGECVDYIQFRSKIGATSQRYCGNLEANFLMDFYVDIDVKQLPVAFGNSFIGRDGELDVVIFISKIPLNVDERTEFVLVFTSYKDCSKPNNNKYDTLRACDDLDTVCINEQFFSDGYINCPYVGCIDELGCMGPAKHEPKPSVGKKVIIGSISTLAILFALFILFLWAFKKHKLFCWAEDFAHPSPTPEGNRNSRIMEMSEQTGARLAEPETNTIRPSAPVLEENKDLPPSYDSLFPSSG